MPDKYASFLQLSNNEPKDSYLIELRQTNSSVALIAPHAGRIEPGTSEICRFVASDDLTYYLFQGRKKNDNNDLHITSTRFDEPQGLAIASSSRVVVTFHGQAGAGHFVNVGGLAIELGHTIINHLSCAGIFASRQDNPSLQGLDQNNICNRGQSKIGVQLEISRGLRDILVTDEIQLSIFSSAIRTAFKEHSIL